MDNEHTLVVVFLRGGADGLTLVPPIGLDAYHRARPTLRVRPEDAIDIDGRFGLARDLAPLERHLREGRLAIVHGVGSGDTTRSHFEAQDLMEHGGASGAGWLARYLRAREAPMTALAAVAIGVAQPESLRGAPGAVVLRSVRDFALGGDETRLVERLARLYSAETGPLATAALDTLRAVERLRALGRLESPPAGNAAYPATAFGRGLRELATLIKADLGLVAATIDMIGGGLGWDTHFVQGQSMPGLMRELAEGLDSFWRDLDTHRSRTTVVVMTEFGRRLAENSSLGTDHGLGGAMFVMGEDLGAPDMRAEARKPAVIRPGCVHSGWSDLDETTLVGPGDVPVTTDHRAVLVEVLRRCDPAVAVERVFPGVPRGTSAGPAGSGRGQIGHAVFQTEARSAGQPGQAGQPGHALPGEPGQALPQGRFGERA